MPNPTRTHREVTKGWHPDEQRWLERATPCVLTRTESEWAKGLSWGLAFHEAVEGEGVTLL